MDGCVCFHWSNNWLKEALKGDRQQFLVWDSKFKTHCIHAPFVEENQRDDDTAAFFASILICHTALDGSVDRWRPAWLIVASSTLVLLFHLPSLNAAAPVGDQLITMFAMQWHFLQESPPLSNNTHHFQEKPAKLNWKHQLMQRTLTSSCWQSSRSERRIKWLVEMDTFACFLLRKNFAYFALACVSSVNGERMIHLLLFFELIIAITCCNRSNRVCAAQK